MINLEHKFLNTIFFNGIDKNIQIKYFVLVVQIVKSVNLG
jgi:hypothetical protein